MNIKYDMGLTMAMNYANIVVLDGHVVKNRTMEAIKYGTQRLLVIDTYFRVSKFYNFSTDLQKRITEMNLTSKVEFITERV